MKKQFESFLDLGAFTIALVYFCLSLGWIYLSTNLIAVIANGNNETFLFLETAKGFGFIIVTSVFLYFAITYYVNKRESPKDE